MTVQWPPADQAGVPLACVVIYSIPRTSILGASFWTRYLGGATAMQVRVESMWLFFLSPLGF